jgi:hypothetical protein
MVSLARILVPCVFILFALLVASNVVIVNRLRRNFPALWTALGRPTHWLYTSRTSKAKHFFTFLDSQRYVETNDRQFINQCRVLKVGWYAFFFLFLAAFVAMIIALVSKNAL